MWRRLAKEWARRVDRQFILIVIGRGRPKAKPLRLI
jgi:hypothetical protein